MYAIPEVCALLNLGQTTVRALVASGQLKAKRVGRVIRVPAKEIERFANEG